MAVPNMAPISGDNNYFGIVDYSVFIGMLGISLGIGIFYAIKGQASASDVLVGGKSMGVLPVATSIMATFMSAAGLLGIPAEVYQYGTQLMFGNIIIVMPLLTFLTAKFVVPVFYNLGTCSSNVYLERRFGRSIRIMACILYCLTMLFYTAVSLFAPAMALAQVTGIKPWITIWSTGLVVTLYTTLGGMKAVVWTDAFQSLIMLIAIIWIMIKGIIDAGGFGQVWRDNWETDRIEFVDFSPSPFIRVTFWSNVLGGTIAMLGAYGTSQATVQRYLSLPTLKDAQKTVWATLPMFSIIQIITLLLSFIIVSRYRYCDPIKTQRVMTADQLFPLFVMDTMGHIPGIPGIFVAGIFSASLSTVSSTINSVTAVVLEDIIKLLFWPKMTEKHQVLLLKIMAALFGIVCIVAATAAGAFGNIIQASMFVFGLLGAPMFGCFFFGLFFPYANFWGALTGVISGFLFNCWMGFGALFNFPYYPTIQKDYVAGCPDLYFNVTGSAFNMTANDAAIEAQLARTNEIFPVFRISFMYYMLIGCIVVCVTGTIVSFLTGGLKAMDKMDTELLVPLVKEAVQKRQKKQRVRLQNISEEKGYRLENMTMISSEKK